MDLVNDTAEKVSRPEPAYKLVWEHRPPMKWMGEKFASHRSYQGHWWIRERKDGTCVLTCKTIYIDHTSVHKSVIEAQRAALAADYALVTKNFLVRKEPGLYEAANGRIKVQHLSGPELRRAMPSGHTTNKAGYAIYVDGRYWGCAFDLRDAQHDISSKRFPV